MAEGKGNNAILYVGIVIALVAGIVLGYVFNSGRAAPATTTIVAPTTTAQTASSTTTAASTNASQLAANSPVQVVKEVLFANKTVMVPAATYNPYYNYVIGCYWTGGPYNFSFYAPYDGYIVFNETNTGMPANFSVQYLGAYISTQKPRYFAPQPYNDTSFCPGFDVLSTTEPWTDISSYNNQTLIVPVKNGTNYVLFYNWNANQKHDVNPFPINVTFSMTYYGFKNTTTPQTPNTIAPNAIPAWGLFQNR